MRLEEMPERVRQLLADKPTGSYYFRPERTNTPQRYLPFRQVELIGRLTQQHIVRPDKSWLHEGPLPKIGWGRGFSALEERLVLRDSSSPKRIRRRSEYPFDPKLDFYTHNGPDILIVSERVFGILQSLGCVAPGMSCELFHETPEGVRQLPWWFMDFPKAPVVDYLRTPAEFKVFVFGDNKKSFTPLPLQSNPESIVTTSEDNGPIVRDAACPLLTLIRRDTFEALRDNDVRGPNYRVLG